MFDKKYSFFQQISQKGTYILLYILPKSEIFVPLEPLEHRSQNLYLHNNNVWKFFLEN